MAGTATYYQGSYGELDALYPSDPLNFDSSSTIYGLGAPLSPCAPSIGLYTFPDPIYSTLAPVDKASPQVGQKRLRESSPPSDYVSWNQIFPSKGQDTYPYATPVNPSHAYPTIFPEDDSFFPNFALQETPFMGTADLTTYDYSSTFSSSPSSLSSTSTPIRSPSHSISSPVYGYSTQQAQAQPTRRATLHPDSARTLIRPSSPVQNIRRVTTHAAQSFTPSYFSDERASQLAYMGAAEAQTLAYSSSIPAQQSDPVSRLPTRRPTLDATGFEKYASKPASSVPSIPVSTIQWRYYDPPSEVKVSPGSLPDTKRRRITHAAPPSPVYPPSSMPSHAAVAKPDILIPQVRYKGQGRTESHVEILFGANGVRLRDVLDKNSYAMSSIPRTNPVLDTLVTRHNVTLRLLWPGGPSAHQSFVSLTKGRMHDTFVNLHDLAHRIADAVHKFFIKWEEKPPTLTDDVALEFEPVKRVRFEDLIVTKLERVSQGSWQAELWIRPAEMPFITERVKTRSPK